MLPSFSRDERLARVLARRVNVNPWSFANIETTDTTFDQEGPARIKCDPLAAESEPNGLQKGEMISGSTMRPFGSEEASCKKDEERKEVKRESEEKTFLDKSCFAIDKDFSCSLGSDGGGTIYGLSDVKINEVGGVSGEHMAECKRTKTNRSLEDNVTKIKVLVDEEGESRERLRKEKTDVGNCLAGNDGSVWIDGSTENSQDDGGHVVPDGGGSHKSVDKNYIELLGKKNGFSGGRELFVTNSDGGGCHRSRFSEFFREQENYSRHGLSPNDEVCSIDMGSTKHGSNVPLHPEVHPEHRKCLFATENSVSELKSGTSDANPVKIGNTPIRLLTAREDIQQFYDNLWPENQEWEKGGFVAPPELASDLFDYQIQTVSWMLYRELEAPYHDGVSGGILADEMGLGKTVEMITLILSNCRWSSKNSAPGRFPMPNSSLVDSDATLVIAPNLLLGQWMDEIAMHSRNSLHCMYYPGLSRLNKTLYERGRRQENIFEHMNIVLTSYDVLSTEFAYTLKPRVKTRSSNTKYKKVESPLMKMRWWRICMDEAQMHGKSASQMAQMCCLLKAVHRWAMSGTPIQKNFSDLKGFFEFLGCADRWYLPDEMLISYLKDIMRRRSKAHVRHQITIPPIQQQTVTMELSTCEKFCYARLANKDHKTVLEEEELKSVLFTATPRKGRRKRSRQHKKNAVAIATNLQLFEFQKFTSCPFQCVAQLYFSSDLSPSMHDRTLTMKLILRVVIQELHTAQLAVCEALNRIGDSYHRLSLDCSEGPEAYYECAMEYYERAAELTQYDLEGDLLKLLASTKDFTCPSKLSEAAAAVCCYHSCVNMAEIHAKLQRWEKRDQWAEKAESAKTVALRSSLNVLAEKREAFLMRKRNTSRLIRNRENYPREPWWVAALLWIEKNVSDFFENLQKGVRQLYDTKFHGLRPSVLSLEVSEVGAIADLLETELDRILRARDSSMSLAKKEVQLKRGELEEFEKSQILAMDLLNEYEMSLVQLVKVSKGPNETHVLRGELNIAERILLHLEGTCTAYHNRLIEKLRVEPTSVTPDQLSTLSELSLILMMADAHFRELELMKLEVATGSIYVEKKLKFCHSLREIESSADLPTHTSLSNSMSLFQERSVQLQSMKDCLETTVRLLMSPFDPLMRFGTKLYLVVKKLQELFLSKESDPNCKALIFSAWPETLIQLSVLLDEIHIGYRFGRGIASGADENKSHNASRQIWDFLKQSSIRVLMLNALKESSGLTLNLANHVFILDQIDSASEDQAIGRVYRMGQKKSTYVYRYYVDRI